MHPLSSYLLPSSTLAIQALESVGARYDARLDLVTEVPGIGPVARSFGVLTNPLAPGLGVTDPAILQPFRALLGLPENAALARRLESGALAYCPANKPAIDALGPALLERRLHAPWALRPMNMDFTAVVSRVHRAQPLPFQAFYSQLVQLSGSPPVVKLGRLFSMPVSGRAEKTILEPEDDDFLDGKIGVVLEGLAPAGR